MIHSADGTSLASSVTGAGPTVVIVGGALSTAADAAPLAEALVAAGLRVVTWDRRARGESGDAAGTSPDREAEDLAAVIDGAGGAHSVLGHSSGAVLALHAASLGVPTGHLFLSEPPVHGGAPTAPSDLPERLQRLVDAGEREEAVATFQLEGVGLPQEMVDGFRAAGQLAALAPLAQSTVYDARLVRDVGGPTAAMRAVGVPVTILRGARTFPVLVAAADRLAAAMPAAELVIVPESVMHRPDPAATAREVAQRMAGVRPPA
ncbi:alpha/beta fold hydrolase [Microbacterium gilvum]|uniref:Alpha/beta hydrolase n=1 Tax=Microbacterium gilvum TaxID=1336204 RepID=A0ABP9AUP6_9MICO